MPSVASRSAGGRGLKQFTARQNAAQQVVASRSAGGRGLKRVRQNPRPTVGESPPGPPGGVD